jgi:hypothetical protein
MALYSKLATTALRLLTKYGAEVTLRQSSVGSGDYDPPTGAVTREADVDTTRKALLLDQPGSQISQRFGNNNQANSLVQQGEKWLYIDANGVAPALQDKIIISHVKYTIVDVQEMGPGGIAVLYMIVVRR